MKRILLVSGILLSLIISCIYANSQRVVCPPGGAVRLYGGMFEDVPAEVIERSDSIEYELIEKSPFRFKVRYSQAESGIFNEAWIDKVNCAVYAIASDRNNVFLYTKPNENSPIYNVVIAPHTPCYVTDFTCDGWVYVIAPTETGLIYSGWLNKFTLSKSE